MTNVHKELVQIQKELIWFQKRAEAMKEPLTDSLVSIFGEQRPAFFKLAEEEIIGTIAGSVVSGLSTLLFEAKVAVY